MSYRKLLITIHGINSDRKWQNAAVGVLGRHFECETLRFDGYRRLGFFRNCFSLRFLAIAFAGLVVAARWNKTVGITLMALSVLVAAWFAIKKRARTVAQFLRDYEDKAGQHRDRAPHAIAHSFGTYLLCKGLEKYPDVAFDRVILWGSVVDAKFPWEAVAARGGVSAVRNEQSKRDFVSRLAGHAFWIRGMGRSGCTGFISGAGIVQNVIFPRFKHSDAARLRKHVEESWLPFLWGIDPTEYVELLDACDSSLRNLRNGSLVSTCSTEPDFDNRKWSWTTSQGDIVSFKDFAQNCLRDVCRNRNAEWFIDTPHFKACYSIARSVFWKNCKAQENHPKWLVVEAVEEAFGHLFAQS